MSTAMSRFAILLPALAAAVAAQVPTGSWLIAAGSPQVPGIWLLDPARTTLTQPQAQSAQTGWIDPVAADDSGGLWYGTTALSPTLPNEIFFVLVAGGAVVIEVQLTAAAIPATGAYDMLSALTLHGGRLWFAMLDGRIGSLDPYATGQTPAYAPSVPLPPGKYVNAMASDGRELFVSTWEQGPLPGSTVFALDPASPTPAWRSVADTHVGNQVAQTSALALGPDGDLLLTSFDGLLRRIDTLTGAVATVASSPTTSGLNCVGYDPWTGVAAISAFSAEVDFIDVASGGVLPGAMQMSVSPSAVFAAVGQPFLRFGRGCAGAAGEPRIRWTGLPVAGGTASVGLVNGTTGGAALLVFGFSNTNSVLGPLPLAGGPFGAPGCDLLVSPDAVAAHATPQGMASQALNLPNSPVVHGLVLHAQWLVTSAVNALGFVASEGLTIHMQ